MFCFFIALKIYWHWGGEVEGEEQRRKKKATVVYLCFTIKLNKAVRTSWAACPHTGRRGSKFTLSLIGIASMVFLTLTSLHFPQETLNEAKTARNYHGMPKCRWGVVLLENSNSTAAQCSLKVKIKCIFLDYYQCNNVCTDPKG